MAERFNFKTWFLFTIWLILNVDTKNISPQLSGSVEDTPSKTFLKDELMRQDANGKISNAIHLCIEEKFQNEQLITCDRRYSSKFACVGSWEGVLRKCDTFGVNTLAAPICVQENSSYVMICEYKNFKSSGLCSPNKAWKNDKKEFGKYMKLTQGFRENIRACKKSDQRMKMICLDKGILVHCSEYRPDSLTSNHSSVILNTFRNKPEITYKKVSTLPRQRDMLQFQNHKTSIDALKLPRNISERDFSKLKSQFQSTGQEKSYHTLVITNKNQNYPALKYNNENKMLSQKGIVDYSNGNDYSSEITLHTNKTHRSPSNNEPVPKTKELSLDQTKVSIDKSDPLKEIELFINRFEKSDEFTTINFDQQLKFRVPGTRQSPRSRYDTVIGQLDSMHVEKDTNNLQRKLTNSEIGSKITEQPTDSDKRLMEEENGFNDSRKPKLLELLYRSPQKPDPEPPSTKIPNKSKGQNMFFHVLKCKNCDIKHDMVVDKNAEDVIPEVETWTFKL